MPRNQPLPAELSAAFSIADAYAAGVGRGRLRGQDLQRPFHGVRVSADDEGAPAADATVWDVRRESQTRKAREYAPRLRPGQFFSHGTAAAILGAPDSIDDTLHVSVFGNRSLPRAAGVVGHRVAPGMAHIDQRDGLPVSSAASTWAMLGDRSTDDLVVLGDYFCRVWREGHGRPDNDTPALTTIARLASAVDSGRRIGALRLRAALPLIRLDSWSPRETRTRLALIAGGLPEPVLNSDLWSPQGTFLACADLVYPKYRVVVEYQGIVHAEQYGPDIERVERLRAAGWTVIQVAAELLANPTELVARVRRALLLGGWSG